jgi:hypothetical protein
MTRFQADDTTVVSDDDEVPIAIGVPQVEEHKLQGVDIKKSMSRRWQQILNRLTRTGPRGNQKPAVGQACLMMTGCSGQEEGQMGVVVNQTPAMVDVAYLGEKQGLTTRRKRPSSLIYLETGLTMKQRSDGSVWIQHDREGR